MNSKIQSLIKEQEQIEYLHQENETQKRKLSELAAAASKVN